MKTLTALSISAALLTTVWVGDASANTFELSVVNQNHTIHAEEQSNQLINIGYRKSFNQYFSASIFGGASLRDSNVRTNTDTFRSTIDGEVQSVDYTSKEKVRGQYGIDLKLTVPVAKGFHLYGKVGHIKTMWSSTYYTPFTDNQPSATPLEDFDSGMSECAVLGIESRCGSPIEEIKSKGDFGNTFVEAGFTLLASDRATVHAGYRKSVSGSVEFDAAAVGLSLRF